MLYTHLGYDLGSARLDEIRVGTCVLKAERKLIVRGQMIKLRFRILKYRAHLARKLVGLACGWIKTAHLHVASALDAYFEGGYEPIDYLGHGGLARTARTAQTDAFTWCHAEIDIFEQGCVLRRATHIA